MHSKLQKFVERPLHSPSSLHKHAILISDSKGNYLKEHRDIITQFGFDIEFQCRGGARFHDYYYWLQRNLAQKVQVYGQIVLYIFLGTCDLTTKKGRFIDLAHENDHAAISYLQYQINRYLNFVSNFPSVSIVFLQIPPYSIQAWNQSRGHRYPSQFLERDLVLYERICIINDYINEINERLGVFSPRFRLDLYRNRKSSQSGHNRTSVNFANYKDGVHPNKLLARCWMKRIIILVFKFCV
ncbi:MAG: hypothetical protein N0E59_21405 [Candidatus Thiodiazotropha taylori]|nr:hypothetical protein [Candidatus Thiodiazotropha taylori]MCW4264394.1 hypothetical protein [Candidatus Thiodiazotropha endolucinida]MCG8044453.1 hypothetical protein [Candidatus Thiodiazotropha taylori]MCG8113317.1 hypothetical protein [Candidatus Thiodiazotropha taylori]MCW4285678.1 hypothetical protein [Candidatus Thiodiazotropha taylori]